MVAALNARMHWPGGGGTDMSSCRVGVIGLGSIGQRMLEAMFAHELFEPVLAWDPSPDATKAATGQFPNLSMVSDSRAIFDDPTIGLVYLACPPKTHREHALSAIAAAKPVLCEKPLGVDLAESQALAAQMEASGLPNAVNLLYASARAATELQAALSTGRLGRVCWVDIHLHLPAWAAKRYAEAPWLAGREQGGFIREVTTHYVFLCQRLFGELTLASRHVEFPQDGVSAETFADVRLRSHDTMITITGTTQGVGPELNHVNVWGDKASFRVRDLHSLERFDGKGWVDAFTPKLRPEFDTYMRQLDGLAGLLKGRPHQLASFREALEAQEIIESILSR
jgi:1,5-anhydro-D-fructose reductase (1,5-anhydro-D-mannitol-forming)